jgi:hypothetical protein
MEFTNDGGKSSRTIWSATVISDDEPTSGLTLHSIDADTGEIVP